MRAVNDQPVWTCRPPGIRDPDLFDASARPSSRGTGACSPGPSAWRSPATGWPGELAGYDILVVRGEDGVVRGFHNVCRHRASRLVRGEEGRCPGRLVCPYHSWTYGLDGRLKKATDFGGDLQLDPVELGLLPGGRRRVARPRLRPHRARRPEPHGVARPHRRDGGRLPARAAALLHRQGARRRGRLEGLRRELPRVLPCRVMHPGLCAAMDIDRYRIDVHQKDGFFHLHAPRREGGLTRGLYFYRFPYLMLNLYDWGSSIATVEPLGPGRVRHINWYLFTDVSPEKAEENHRSADWSARSSPRTSKCYSGSRNLNPASMIAALSRRNTSMRSSPSRTWSGNPSTGTAAARPSASPRSRRWTRRRSPRRSRLTPPACSATGSAPSSAPSPPASPARTPPPSSAPRHRRPPRPHRPPARSRRRP